MGFTVPTWALFCCAALRCQLMEVVIFSSENDVFFLILVGKTVGIQREMVVWSFLMEMVLLNVSIILWWELRGDGDLKSWRCCAIFGAPKGNKNKRIRFGRQKLRLHCSSLWVQLVMLAPNNGWSIATDVWIDDSELMLLGFNTSNPKKDINKQYLSWNVCPKDNKFATLVKMLWHCWLWCPLFFVWTMITPWSLFEQLSLIALTI